MGVPTTTIPILFAVLSSLSIIAALVPTTWHYRASNTPGIILIFWIVLGNLINLTNNLTWSGNVESAWDGAILCDIEVKLLVGTGVGCIAAATAIARKLALATGQIAGGRSGLSERAKRGVDLAICLGPPLFMMLSHYIVQPNRYNLFEVSGCAPSVDDSWLAVLLVIIWSPALAVVASVYCLITLFRIVRHRREMSRILSSNGSGLTTAKFIRLFGFTFLIVVLVTPVVFYVFVSNTNHNMTAFSWKNTHGASWDLVLRIATGGRINFDRWVPTAAGFFNFAFFGTGKDAMDTYKGWVAKMGVPKSWLSKERSPVLPFHWNSTVSSQDSTKPMVELHMETLSRRLSRYTLPPVFTRSYNSRIDMGNTSRFSDSDRTIVNSTLEQSF